MPDKVEEILKEIHVMFAKCDTYHNSPDKVIVSKTEMFALLEQLNESIYEVLDQYEATARSRERARIELDKQAAETVAKAKIDSDDVHAATMLYTDTMLDNVKAILEKTRSAMKREMVEMIASFELQEEVLEQNKESVKAGLTELHDSAMYLEMLTDVRKKAADKRKKSLANGGADEDEIPEEIPETKANAASNIVIRVDRPGENTGVTYSTKHTRNKKNKKKGASGANATPQEHEEGTPYSADEFNLDAEYEQWKQEQEEAANPEGAAKSEKKGFFESIFGSKK